jgi:hypothetical protein
MIILEDEYLFEMATVYRNEKHNVSVAINPDSNRIGGAYFKFYNSTDYKKATKVIRILFNEPKYVEHDGKELWELNSHEKKLLINCLKDRYRKYKYINCTVWDATKFDWNFEYLGLDLELEEYLNGEYDERYKNNPSYVPSTLEMPDYTLIEF